MLDTLSHDWWTLVFRGVVAIILGIVAFAFPGITVAALTLLFGFYALVDGVLALAASVRLAGQHRQWWVSLVEAILGIAAGLVAFVYTLLTAIVLLYIMASWAILTGIMEIMIAIELRRYLNNEWLMALGGVISIALGVALFAYPAAGLVAWAWMFGAYAVAFGVLLVALGLKLRRHSHTSGYLAQH